MTPEQELIADLLAQVEASAVALSESVPLIDPFPEDAEAFKALPVIGRVAATAMFKEVEQLEGGLASLFRVILKSMGVGLKGLYPMDIANHMIELDVLDDATEWLKIVKLRNELVHEYPLAAPDQFAQFSRAHTAIATLLDATRRVAGLIAARKLLDD